MWWTCRDDSVTGTQTSPMTRTSVHDVRHEYTLHARHHSIAVQLPAINWQCRHIARSHVVVGRSLRWPGTAEMLTRPFLLNSTSVFGHLLKTLLSMQCIRGFGEDATFYITLHFESVGRMPGTVSGLYKIEWWGVGVVICLERGGDCLHMVQLLPSHPQTHHLLPDLNPDCFYLSGTGILRLSWKRGC